MEKTLHNNKTDAQVAKKLINKLKRFLPLKKGAFFIADAAYDVRELYNFIVNTLKTQTFIPINPGNQQPEKTLGQHGCPLCEAKLEMKSWGSWTESLRQRLKFRCPIKARSKFAPKFPNGCPIDHPRFLAGYGCTKYLDITEDARPKVPRDTPLFMKTYRLRQGVEQYFARLGNREAEQTIHYKLRSVQNQMTIAHLSMSLIAYAATVLIKKPDKIRCYRTFVKEPLPLKIVT